MGIWPNSPQTIENTGFFHGHFCFKSGLLATFVAEKWAEYPSKINIWSNIPEKSGLLAIFKKQKWAENSPKNRKKKRVRIASALSGIRREYQLADYSPTLVFEYGFENLPALN